MTTPMTLGNPVGPNVEVTTSAEVDTLLTNTAEVTFAGIAPDRTAIARGIHWLAQVSAREIVVASARYPNGGGGSSVYVIERTDDQGRDWACVTSTAWTAGLFLSKAEALAWASEVALRETPEHGWDYSCTTEVPARSHVRVC